MFLICSYCDIKQILYCRSIGGTTYSGFPTINLLTLLDKKYLMTENSTVLIMRK